MIYTTCNSHIQPSFLIQSQQSFFKRYDKILLLPGWLVTRYNLGITISERGKTMKKKLSDILNGLDKVSKAIAAATKFGREMLSIFMD